MRITITVIKIVKLVRRVKVLVLVRVTELMILNYAFVEGTQVFLHPQSR